MWFHFIRWWWKKDNCCEDKFQQKYIDLRLRFFLHVHIMWSCCVGLLQGKNVFTERMEELWSGEKISLYWRFWRKIWCGWDATKWNRGFVRFPYLDRNRARYRRNHILRVPYSRPYPSRMEGISNKISGWSCCRYKHYSRRLVGIWHDTSYKLFL